MHTLHFMIVAFAVLGSVGCNSEIEAKLRSQEAEIKQLKADVAELKSRKPATEHHYELRKAGFRTFRFDSATGETCIQLTTPADWKNKNTKSQSCECVDAASHWSDLPLDTEVRRKTADYEYNFRVNPACGD